MPKIPQRKICIPLRYILGQQRNLLRTIALSFAQEQGWLLNSAQNDDYIILYPRFFAEKDSLYHILAKMNTSIIEKSNGSAYKWAWGHMSALCTVSSAWANALNFKTYYHELMYLDPLVAPGDSKSPSTVDDRVPC